jgi:NAD(P)H-hydrate epimerase
MEIIFSGAEAQKMDEISIRDYHFPGLTLMENAGERIFQAIQFHYEEIFPVGFLIGKGNNGGDGLVIARKMFQAGYSVGVFILAQGEGELSQSAKINFQILRSLKVPYQWIPDQDHYEASRNTLLSFPVLIDALLGIGLNSPLKGIIKTVVEDLNRDYGGKIWAIDVPTGLSTGEEYFEPILKADHTFTVEMPKNHMIDYPGRSFVGKLDAVKIGFPEAVKKELSPKRFLVEESDVEIPRRQRDSHKGTYGKTLIAAGSRQYTGAALLTLSTAARTGTGLLHYLGESEEYVRWRISILRNSEVYWRARDGETGNRKFFRCFLIITRET